MPIPKSLLTFAGPVAVPAQALALAREGQKTLIAVRDLPPDEQAPLAPRLFDRRHLAGGRGDVPTTRAGAPLPARVVLTTNPGDHLFPRASRRGALTRDDDDAVRSRACAAGSPNVTRIHGLLEAANA
jgi:hypothetical protein